MRYPRRVLYNIGRRLNNYRGGDYIYNNLELSLGREVWRLDLSPLHISLGRLFLTCLHCQGRKHAGTPKSVRMKLEASDVGAWVRWLATGMVTRAFAR